METIRSCCCCLLQPPDLLLKPPYSRIGVTEIFSNMLEECFQIHLILKTDQGICEACVGRLRDACDFKLQVQRSQAELQARRERAPQANEEPQIKSELADYGDNELIEEVMIPVGRRNTITQHDNTSQYQDISYPARQGITVGSLVHGCTLVESVKRELSGDDSTSEKRPASPTLELARLAPAEPQPLSALARKQLTTPCFVRLERLRDKLPQCTNRQSVHHETSTRMRLQAALDELTDIDFDTPYEIQPKNKKQLDKHEVNSFSDEFCSELRVTEIDFDTPYELQPKNKKQLVKHEQNTFSELCLKESKLKDIINGNSNSNKHKSDISVIREQICYKQFNQKSDVETRKSNNKKQLDKHEKSFSDEFCLKESPLKDLINDHRNSNKHKSDISVIREHNCYKQFNQKSDVETRKTDSEETKSFSEEFCSKVSPLKDPINKNEIYTEANSHKKKQYNPKSDVEIRKSETADIKTNRKTKKDKKKENNLDKFCLKESPLKDLINTHKIHTEENHHSNSNKQFKSDILVFPGQTCYKQFNQKSYVEIRKSETGGLIMRADKHEENNSLSHEFCSKESPIKDLINKHKIHTEENHHSNSNKQFKSDIFVFPGQTCYKQFNQKSDVEIRKSEKGGLIMGSDKHEENNSLSHEFCSKESPIKDLINKHKIHTKENHHSKSNKRFKSGILVNRKLTSYKQFNQKINVDIRKSETGENCGKPFICEICYKLFKEKKLLDVHKVIHSDEKPFICDVCSKQFRQKSNLKIHQVTHTGEKNYICEICAKQFRQKGNLEVHKRVHTGDKPYACEICYRQFRQVCQLETHTRLHTGETPYTCNVCFKQYKQKANLQAHQLSHSVVKSIFFNSD